MSGIQTHTQDPISPSKASSVTPTAPYNENPSTISAIITTPAPNQYSSARPGAAAPTSTSLTVGNGPPPPQPGAVPVPQPPMTTAKASLPPPPKAGERPQPQEYHSPINATPTKLQPSAPQWSQPSPVLGPTGLPPGPTTSVSTETSFPASAPPSSLSATAEAPTQATLEHPPGYVQNPYASDMTPDARFATAQQDNESRSVSLPSLGYNDNVRKRANSGMGDDDSVWDAAKKWGKEMGKQLGDLHEQVWDTVGRK